ncbi:MULTISPECIES: DUF983 domain-containing protein [Methylosinus]|uniref:DUF983 domain-containing protein n=1 Tax=Methylosinus trichosporium (strain ATCC 35070 / NCIMB 11131 / UNIQEM 75 / OB3b) TaxID=595536 RepID=A0A2D2D5R7_METT3|nr:MULTISPECIES: DUF983 domain-containing protein [Methylosinus]ATQ70315.1 DUF983 domain-containing protein [Methylosinus trichosporium OB3b]OBS53476.1 hypothetical protein A8B73_05830 [Methylosinus sp. 3S-1]
MSAEPEHLPSPYVTGLLGRCPRCGKGSLFSGFLTLAPTCDVCGLDLTFADAGDGPAVFVMTLAGFIVVGAALYVEVAYSPPYWMHFAIFLPLTILVCAGLLRPTKGLLITLQYANKAEEGRRADEG